MGITPKTIYLEIDEEVTSVIDKIRKTEFTDIVLVVPKDASISQSVVNLKLIKRKAEELNKNVSLVTQDKVARNLASKVGLATAMKANEVPHVLAEESDAETVGPLEETNEIIFDKDPIQHQPEELTVTEGEDVREEVAIHEDVDKEIAKREKSLLPKFPWKWAALIGSMVLGALFLIAYIYLPRARATIYVAAEKRPLSLNFTGEKDAKLDTDKVIIPTQVVEVTKEESKKYPATGKKEVGEKATGTINISAKVGSFPSYPVTLVVGSRFSPEGSSLIYKSTTAVAVPKFPSVATVSVSADTPGDNYNGYGEKTFILPSSSDFIASSTAGGMTGGTNKEVIYVTQGDFNSAKDALAKEVGDAVTTEFNTKSSELKIIDDSKKSEVVSATSSPEVNGEATEFTLTVKVTTKALAFNMNDISTMVSAEVLRQLGSVKQIIDDGASSAKIEVDSADIATGKVSGTIKTDVYVSTKLDQEAIKVELSGLNDSKATNYLMGIDGIDSVKFEYWPKFIKSFSRLKNHIFLSVVVSDSSRN